MPNDFSSIDFDEPLDHRLLVPMLKWYNGSDDDTLQMGADFYLRGVNRYWLRCVYIDNKSPCIVEGSFMTQYYPQCCAALQLIGASNKMLVVSSYGKTVSLLSSGYRDNMGSETGRQVNDLIWKQLINKEYGDCLLPVINKILDVRHVSHELAHEYMLKCMAYQAAHVTAIGFGKSCAMGMSNRGSDLHSLIQHTGQFLERGIDMRVGTPAVTMRVNGKYVPPNWHKNTNGGRMCSLLTFHITSIGSEKVESIALHPEVDRAIAHTTRLMPTFPVGTFSGNYGSGVAFND